MRLLTVHISTCLVHEREREREGEREREREIHYVHWASKAYEDESVFMSEAHRGWQ